MTELDYSLHYERFHPDTVAHKVAMTDYMAKEIAPFLPADKDGAVLDIGCGFGFAMLALKKLGFKNIRGIDISQQQIERARQNGLDVETVADTSVWLRKNRNTFSSVLMFDVLEHVPVEHQLDVIQTVYESLVPNGRLIVQTPNANSPLASRWRYIDFTHHTSFTEHSLHHILSAGGFEEVRIDAEKGMNWFPKRFWRKDSLHHLRRYIVRWCWLQVYKAELPFQSLDDISFELNLKAVAIKRAETNRAAKLEVSPALEIV